MTLAAILDLRMKRQVPQCVLTVVIGEAPRAWKDDPSLIEIKPGSEPRLMDWRPVVGLPVAFYMVHEDWTLMDAAVESAHKAGAKLFGLVHKGTAHSLMLDQGSESRHDQALAKNNLLGMWGSLCQ